MAATILRKDVLDGTTLQSSIYYGANRAAVAYTITGVTETTDAGLSSAETVAMADAVATGFLGDTDLQPVGAISRYMGRPDHVRTVVQYRDAPDTVARWDIRLGERAVLTHWIQRLDGSWLPYIVPTPRAITYPMIPVTVGVRTFRIAVNRTQKQIDLEPDPGIINNSDISVNIADIFGVTGLYQRTFTAGTLKFNGVEAPHRLENGKVKHRAVYIYSECKRGWEHESPLPNAPQLTGVFAPANGSQFVPGTYGNVQRYGDFTIPTS